jgi:excinuclease ABC subunit B
MYADKITPSMQTALDETNRRRALQIAYNTERGVDPQPLRKKIADITDLLAAEDADTEATLASAAQSSSRMGSGRSQSRGRPASRASKVTAPAPSRGGAAMAMTDLTKLIAELTEQMHAAAANLQFELAARYRDELAELKKELRGIQAAQ